MESRDVFSISSPGCTALGSLRDCCTSRTGSYAAGTASTGHGAWWMTRSVVLPRHDHMSEVYSINTADTRLTDEILDFVKTGK